MLINPQYVGHVFLQLGQRCFYLAAPRGESPDLQWLATAEVLIVTEGFPNGIRYRTDRVRMVGPGQVTCTLVLADRMQARMEERWFGPKRDVTITKVILRLPNAEATLERGPRAIYRVAA
ncbi:hypothetical protein EPO33_05365 [Patescibacteria group bacterium]|nr:MAG: hypothetical protein EPO33_05365 [Patescibacteria group bacterium]